MSTFRSTDFGHCQAGGVPAGRHDYPRARGALRNSPRGFRGLRLENLVVNQPLGVELDNVKQAAKWFKGKGDAKTSLHAIKGPCDFVGCFTASGRCLYFDCKESKDPSSLSTNKSHLSENQRLRLIRKGEANAVAGILAMRTTDDQLFWVPWTMLRVRPASIAWDDMLSLGWAGRAIPWAEIEAAHPVDLGKQDRFVGMPAAGWLILSDVPGPDGQARWASATPAGGWTEKLRDARRFALAELEADKRMDRKSTAVRCYLVDRAVEWKERVGLGDELTRREALAVTSGRGAA